MTTAVRALLSNAVFVCAAWSIGAAPARAQHPDLDPGQQSSDTCLECHDDVREAMAAGRHKATEGGCVVCHDLAKAQSPFLRADVTALCTTCHLLAPLPNAAPASTAPRLSVPDSLLPRQKQLNLNASGAGHPVANHPVDGAADPLQPARQLSCVSCHRPHGSEVAKLLAFPTSRLCETCHKV